jgi:hypothetical protein
MEPTSLGVSIARWVVQLGMHGFDGILPKPFSHALTDEDARLITVKVLRIHRTWSGGLGVL